MRINKNLSSILIFSFFINNGYANNCLITNVKLSKGRKVVEYRSDIHISLEDTSTKQIIGSGDTDIYGNMCLEYKDDDVGKEVKVVIGDSKKESFTGRQNWSSWKIASPANSISYIPKKQNHVFSIVLSPPLKNYNIKTTLSSTFNVTISTPVYCNINRNTPIIQTGSYKKYKSAVLVYNSLRREYQTCIDKVFIKKRKYNRVIVMLKDRASAKKTCRKITKKYGYKCY